MIDDSAERPVKFPTLLDPGEYFERENKFKADVLKLADEAERMAIGYHAELYHRGDWRRDPETRDVATLIDSIREQLIEPDEDE